MALGDDVLAVMRDGARMDRFLEITCADDQKERLFLTAEDGGRVQFRVPVFPYTQADDEWVAVAHTLIEAMVYLLANSQEVE